MTASLGYDPRPDLTAWQGTPLPPVDRPLGLNPGRERIAAMVWWHGPPWCVLRNRNVYLWRVMDYATTESLLYTVQDLPAGDWRIALQAAKPGRLSAGAWTFWSLTLGLLPLGAVSDWPSLAHRLAQPRPPAGRQAPLAAVATGDAGLCRPVFRAASALAPCFLARQDAAAARARKTGRS